MKEVGFRAVSTGSCLHPELATIMGGSLWPVPFPALAFVLTHPDKGTVLFDTGYDPAFIEATRPFPERLYRWLTPPSVEHPVVDALKATGVQPEDVRHLVLSHFHGDHCSGLSRFPNAVIHCSGEGLRSVWGKNRIASLVAGTPRGLLPEGLPARCRFFEDAPRMSLPAGMDPFDDGADILGDGSVLAVPLPGHCPGHWGVVIREARGFHFLVADAAWSSKAIRENRPPPAVTSTLLGSTTHARRTLYGLHRLRMRNPDVLLTPSHCRERAWEETQ